MATGMVPFSGTTVALIFDGILHSDAAPATKLNSRLPFAIENIFGKALEKDADLRYQTAAELRADLKRLRRDSDAGHSGSVAAVPVEKNREARPRRLWRWAAVAAILLAAIAGYLLTRPGPPPRVLRT